MSRRIGILHELQHITRRRNISHLAGAPKVSSNDVNRRSQLGTAVSQLDRQGTTADIAIYASLVRSCGDAKDLSHGRRVHAHIRASGRDRNTFVANVLVQMYGKCGSVEDALNVFNRIAERDMFSWNFMIAVYAQNGHEADALQLYRHMQMEGVKPNMFTFLPILSASATLRALVEGKQIHRHIVACGLESDVAVSTALLNMYGKCGALKDAREVFEGMPLRDVISWNAMIAAYAQNGHGKEALKLFRKMGFESVKPDRITFLSTLDASASLASLENGRAVHESVVASGLEFDVAVSSALVNMYGKCGSVKDARAVFDTMQERNVISWTAMIAVYAQNGSGKEALELFRQMDSEGVTPNSITFLSILDACVSLGSLKNGRTIHERIVASGFESDIAVETALVNMYGNCGSLKDARLVFDEMHERNVISWTAMISACTQNGHGKEALKLFRQMDLEGVKPNKITFRSALDACASLPSLENGKVIHERIVACGFESDVAVRNALLNMYGKCGAVKDARKIFNKMHERNLISWTTMITSYAQNGCGREALELFRQMELEGVKPDRITFLSILDACANLASIENGRAIHRHIVANGFEMDITVRNSLVNMYGKCGVLMDARAIFDTMHEHDVISWNAMIAAYSQNGHGKEALELFRKMDLNMVKPNEITFLSILNACSHTGLLNAGWQYFLSMSQDYGIAPLEDHYVCMSDLLGRVGCLDEAEDLINNMPIQPSAVAWTTLLGACRIHGDVERGTHVAIHVSELDPENASPYLLLSNIYAAAGRWDDAAKVRKVWKRGD